MCAYVCVLVVKELLPALINRTVQRRAAGHTDQLLVMCCIAESGNMDSKRTSKMMVPFAADSRCDPTDTKQTFVEELVRLPQCFLCYTPATGHLPISRRTSAHTTMLCLA